MGAYEPFELSIILLCEEDCICTSGENFEDYNDNELPLIPFIE